MSANDDNLRPTTMIGPILCFVIGLVLLIVSGWLVLTDRILLTPANVTESDLTTFNQRFEFCCQWWTLIGVWLVLNIFVVIGCRFVSWKYLLEPLSGSTDAIDLSNAILRNSMEQALIYILLQLTMLPKLSPSIAIKLIPFINLIWFLGRIGFTVGYPRFRGLGNAMSFPLLLPMTVYAIYLNVLK